MESVRVSPAGDSIQGVAGEARRKAGDWWELNPRHELERVTGFFVANVTLPWPKSSPATRRLLSKCV